ncbi:MAG: GNAT family N-acetyltransferase [Gammaproteobacteria bacterium]
MHCLSGKARNQTRRGLEQCVVREVTFAELAQQGLRLNRETLVRQKRRISADFDEHWRRYFTAAEEAEGACAWGAFAGERLAAYLIAFEMESVAHVLIVRSSTEHLKIYPNNVLLYGFLQHALGKGGYREVSIGLESIRKDLTSLDHFKRGMGFSEVEIGQRVELAPALARMLPSPILSVLLGIAPVWQHGENLDKLAGLLQWYREQQCR